MNNKFRIYKFTNKSNGKVYIGQTCNNRRGTIKSLKGSAYEHCVCFSRAIKKYGWENFDLVNLVENITLEEANMQEKYFIDFYDSTNPEKGYNILRGGRNSYPSEEAKKKMREAKLGKKLSEEHKKNIRNNVTVWNKGKLWSEEAKKKMSESHKGKMMGKNNPMWGKKLSEDHKKLMQDRLQERLKIKGHPMQGKRHTDEARARMKASHLGVPLSEKHRRSLSEAGKGRKVSEETRKKISIKNSKKVMCIESGIIYNSIKEASEILNISYKGLSYCCSRGKGTSGSFHWCFV